MGWIRIMSRRKSSTDIALKPPDKEEMEAALSSLQEELNYRLICEMYTSARSDERMLWVERISMTAYEQGRVDSKGIVSVWRRIQNYFRKKKERYGVWQLVNSLRDFPWIN